jgi:hypothetical protein
MSSNVKRIRLLTCLLSICLLDLPELAFGISFITHKGTSWASHLEYASSTLHVQAHTSEDLTYFIDYSLGPYTCIDVEAVRLVAVKTESPLSSIETPILIHSQTIQTTQGQSGTNVPSDLSDQLDHLEEHLQYQVFIF